MESIHVYDGADQTDGTPLEYGRRLRAVCGHVGTPRPVGVADLGGDGRPVCDDCYSRRPHEYDRLGAKR